jgi:hypothetical protein
MTEPAKPVDTFQLLSAKPDDTPKIRALRYAVIGMGFILFVGLGTVFARIFYLATRTAAPDSAASTQSGGPGRTKVPIDLSLMIPAGAALRTQSLSGNRLSLHYDAEGQEAIVIVDIETGLVVHQIRWPAARRQPR